MNDLLINLTCVVGAYLAGSIPWGLVVGKLFGVDPRTVGSGNIGATNVARVLGPLGFVAVYLLDGVSGFLPVFLLSPIATMFTATGNSVLLGIVVILGHVFTPWLGFKGGKGVATASGVTVALVPWGFVAALVCFLVILLMTRIVSISSLAASVALPLFVIYYTGIKGWMPDDYWLLSYSLLITVVVFITHHKNMGRLFRGTESRVGAPKKDGE